MTDKTKFVMKGYIELSDEEKADFIDELNNYNKSGRALQENFSERVGKSINSVVFGPLSKQCPCCGR